MPPVSLTAFLNTRCPGWQSRSVDVVNRRLHHLGRHQISFNHRNRGPVTGIIQLVDASPYDSVFWFGRENRWLTVADYFLIRYGETVDGRVRRIAYVHNVYDEDEEVEEPSLFPIEFLSISA
ncbi:hypothetical protein B9Z55_015515 [Caenorhabditis nigoni]|uniref:PAZ domain-containing protein n=1 Tax=Caenorhabditis nigoni TaxID=1611254 RepID=A0A2G5UB67_9PELO|nr:hypothetical protein B9Z55_015515 [Caenorhabditis nigoni]